MNIIIDTNIFVSALIRDSITRKLIINSQHNLLFPEFEFIEIKRHKQDILEKSGLLDEKFKDLFSNLLKYVKIIKTKKTINYKEQAFDIIGNIDKDDVIFVSASLAFNCPIWSDDRHFQKQDKVKILTTKDMVSLNNKAC